MNESFNRPYPDRRFVLFIEEKAYQEKEARAKKPSNDPASYILGKDSWKEIAKDIVIPGRSLAKQFRSARDTVKRFSDDRYEKAGIKVASYSWSESVILPPGHPRSNVLYVAHPTNEKIYFPLADFHRHAFEDKFAELISILMHLGATQIEVEHMIGWGKDFASHLSVETIQGNADIKTGHKDDKEQKLIYIANLPGREESTLPSQLNWYPHEAGWKQFVEGRTKFGLRESSLRLEYKEDYGINANFKAKAEDLGLDIGGKFESHESTVWSVTVQFNR